MIDIRSGSTKIPYYGQHFMGIKWNRLIQSTPQQFFGVIKLFAKPYQYEIGRHSTLSILIV